MGRIYVTIVNFSPLKHMNQKRKPWHGPRRANCSPHSNRSSRLEHGTKKDPKVHEGDQSTGKHSRVLTGTFISPLISPSPSDTQPRIHPLHPREKEGFFCRFKLDSEQNVRSSPRTARAVRLFRNTGVSVQSSMFRSRLRLRRNNLSHSERKKLPIFYFKCNFIRPS